MKKVIRLTEGDLHRIVKESVNRVLQEGQGFNMVKNVYRTLRDEPIDDSDLDYFGTPEWDEDKERYINNGGDYKYYDENGEFTNTRGLQLDPPYKNKPVNNGFTGRLGRRAAANTIGGMLGAVKAGRKIKRGFNNLFGR